MENKNSYATLDDVMDWYSLARERGEPLERWQEAYPYYADDLAEFEALLRIDERMPDPELSQQEEEGLIERAIGIASQLLARRPEGS